MPKRRFLHTLRAGVAVSHKEALIFDKRPVSLAINSNISAASALKCANYELKWFCS